jgi:hypothetical protein
MNRRSLIRGDETVSDPRPAESTELESRKVAEASRQTEWASPGFIREMFLGSFRLDLIHPYPLSTAERPEFAEYYAKFEAFLRNDVDSCASTPPASTRPRCSKGCGASAPSA